VWPLPKDRDRDKDEIGEREGRNPQGNAFDVPVQAISRTPMDLLGPALQAEAVWRSRRYSLRALRRRSSTRSVRASGRSRPPFRRMGTYRAPGRAKTWKIPANRRKPTPGLEPGTPSLRVMERSLGEHAMTGKAAFHADFGDTPSHGRTQLYSLVFARCSHRC
jgi:hypothetical protein